MDAATHGLAVMRSTWQRRSVVEVGRLEERWRFRGEGGGRGARSRALAQEENSAGTGGWPEVPRRLLRPDRWRLVHAGQVRDRLDAVENVFWQVMCAAPQLATTYVAPTGMMYAQSSADEAPVVLTYAAPATMTYTAPKCAPQASEHGSGEVEPLLAAPAAPVASTYDGSANAITSELDELIEKLRNFRASSEHESEVHDASEAEQAEQRQHNEVHNSPEHNQQHHEHCMYETDSNNSEQHDG